MLAGNNSPFDPAAVPCTCEGEPNPNCICAAAGGAEKVLRFVMAVDGVLSPAQREWCLCEISQVEGHTRADHESDSCADLARATLEAWTDYCRDKGLM